jgi:hypothetical protein
MTLIIGGVAEASQMKAKVTPLNQKPRVITPGLLVFRQWYE